MSDRKFKVTKKCSVKLTETTKYRVPPKTVRARLGS